MSCGWKRRPDTPEAPTQPPSPCLSSAWTVHNCSSPQPWPQTSVQHPTLLLYRNAVLLMTVKPEQELGNKGTCVCAHACICSCACVCRHVRACVSVFSLWMLRRGRSLRIGVKPLPTSVPWSLRLFREINLQRTHQENTRLPCLRHGDCPLFLGIEGREGGCGTNLGGSGG